MTKQKLTCRQARWALYLSHFKFTIVHKPGTQNKLDALSRHPDLKEGIASVNEEHILLDNKYFLVQVICPTSITVSGDTSLQQRIKFCQEYNQDISIALESILKNGPRSISKGLEEWNLENGIILHRGQVYVPKDENLRRDIVKNYHNHIAIGHPSRWKTYELVSRGMSTFVKSYMDRCATCQSTKIKPRNQVPLQPNQVPTDVWGVITVDFITDLPFTRIWLSTCGGRLSQ